MDEKEFWMRIPNLYYFHSLGLKCQGRGQFTRGKTQTNLHYLEVALVFPCNILVPLPKKLDILLG